MAAAATASDAETAAAAAAGARLVAKGEIVPLSGEELADAGEGVVLVRVRPEAVNDVAEPLASFEVTELDGSPPVSRGDEPTRCDRCGRLFSGPKAFSQVSIHRGKPCAPPPAPEGEEPHPLRVAFPASRVQLVGPCLRRLGIELEGEGQAPPGHRSFLTDRSLLRVRLAQLAFAEASAHNLERWYTALRAHTAETFVVPLEDEDLEMLRKLHAAWHMGSSHSVDPATLERHGSLERRVQSVWDEAGPGQRYFVKTSMRSPKDAVQVPPGPTAERLRRQVEACAVTSAAGALDLCAASKRVMTDIGLFLKCRAAAEERLNLVLRRWDDGVSGSVEWRCFVSEGRLTAASQYHCYNEVPEIVAALRDGDGLGALRAVRDRLAAFQRQVHSVIVEALGVDSYVLDVATQVGGDAEAPVRLVEINPLQTSGAALFSWRDNQALLLAGRPDGLVELRVARA